MRYLSLKIVSVLIRLAAVATAVFVVVLFVNSIDREYQLVNNLRALGSGLETNMAQLGSLLNQFGVDTSSIPTSGLNSFGEDYFNSLTLKAVQDLFVGLVASLLIFGFGGIIRLLIDIAERDRQVEYLEYTHQPDSEIAPVAPQTRLNSPPPPDHSRKKIPVPPGTSDERLRNKHRR